MKLVHLLFGGALAIGTLVGLSIPAAADSRTHVSVTIGWSNGYGYPHAQHHRYRNYHRPYYAPHRYNRRHHPRHHEPRYRGHTRHHYGYTDGYYGDGRNYRSYGRAACHPVFKFGRWHGRPAKIGGTMCYNRHGRGYVLNGSRYLIHYR